MNRVEVELSPACVGDVSGVDARVSDDYDESGVFFVECPNHKNMDVGDILGLLHRESPEAADILDAALQNDTVIYVDDSMVMPASRAAFASSLSSPVCAY